MLTWEKTAPNTIVAHLNGYTYTITEDEDEEMSEVEITTPDGGVKTKEFDSIEEAKNFCKNRAKKVGSA